MHCSASQNVRLCLLRCSTFFYAKGLYCESTTMRLSHSYPLSTSVEQTAPQASGEQITPLQMAPGQGLWCHLEASAPSTAQAGACRSTLLGRIRSSSAQAMRHIATVPMQAGIGWKQKAPNPCSCILPNALTPAGMAHGSHWHVGWVGSVEYSLTAIYLIAISAFW